MVMKSLFFFLKDMKQSRLHINHGEFRSSDKLRFVDNKLFERWNYDTVISLNLLFRTFFMILSLLRHGRKH